MVIQVLNKPITLIDISRGGFRLFAKTVPTSNRISAALNVENQIIELWGVVRWVQEKPLLNYKEIGVEIEKAPDNYYQYIDKICVRDQ